ncbi:MAG: LuxR C-terminal-related transcriptional regulator [Actinomycetota bacterium]
MGAVVPEREQDVVRVVITYGTGLEHQGILALLAADPSIDVGPAAERLDDAERRVVEEDADVLVVDARMLRPGASGGLGVISARRPALAVLILGEARDEDAILGAFDMGAKGYVLKTSARDQLGHAVRALAGGGVFIDPAVAGVVTAIAAGRRVPGPFGLTPQEIRVLRHLPRGMTNREIAAQLRVSEETIKTHVRSILRKLGASDRARAAAIALQEGIA